MTQSEKNTRVSRVYRLFASDIRSLTIDDSLHLNSVTRDHLVTDMMYAQCRMTDIVGGDYPLPDIDEWSDLRILHEILLAAEVSDDE